GPLGRPPGIARADDVAAARQGPEPHGERLPGGPTHHHGESGGDPLEVRQTLRGVEGHAVAVADHTVAGLHPHPPDRPAPPPAPGSVAPRWASYPQTPRSPMR